MLTNAGLSTKTVYINSSTTSDTKAGKIAISNAGPNVDSLEYYQAIPTGTLNPGTYTLRFTAKSSLARTINVALHHLSCTPTLLWWTSSCNTINLDNSARNFVCTFQVSQPTSGTQLPYVPVALNFLLGNAPTNNGNPIQHDVWIDNVSLVRSQ